MYVLDGSPSGLCLLHRGALPAPGHSCRVVLHLPDTSITADCEVVRTDPHMGNGRGEFFQSGLRIVSADENSLEMIRSVFANP